MKTKSIPYELINQSLQDGLLDTLAYWVQLKSQFNTPIFYNHTTRTIAKVLNCSPTTSAKHIAIMIEKGWARIHHKHLCLTSTNKLKKDLKTFIIKVMVSKTKSHQVHYLRHTIIQRNLRFQDKQIKVKTEIVKKAKTPYCKLSPHEKKVIRNFGGLKEFEKFAKDHDRLTVSNKKIGEYLNRSQSSGARYQKQFNKLGLMKSIEHYRTIPLYLLKDHAMENYNLEQQAKAHKNGFISSQTSNTIVLFSFPLIPFAKVVS